MKFIYYKNEIRNFDQVKAIYNNQKSLIVEFFDSLWKIEEDDEIARGKIFYAIILFLNSPGKYCFDVENEISLIYFDIK